MEITVTPAFAVPIFSLQLADFAAHQSALVAAVLAEQARDPGVQASNRYGWHSRGDFYTTSNSEIQWLMRNIGTFARGALGSYNPAFRESKMTMVGGWANVSPQGAWNAPHNHMPSYWSGVVYLRAEDCGEPGDARDTGGLIEFLNPHPMGHSYAQQLTSTFVPKDGLALLFPAYLVHFVHPNRQAKLRISFSFNIDVVL